MIYTLMVCIAATQVCYSVSGLRADPRLELGSHVPLYSSSVDCLADAADYNRHWTDSPPARCFGRDVSWHPIR